MPPNLSAAELGFRTELIVLRFGGEVERHDGYTVVRTPANPTFFWGNCLVFDRAPGAGDIERWPRLFATHIAVRQPASRHWAFGWLEDKVENEAGDVAPFLAQGCTLLESLVMTATEVRPNPPRVPARLRPVGAGDWAALHELQVLAREPEHPVEAYSQFKTRQIARWREMCDAGRGQWFGAFVDGALAAALGIYAEAECADGVRLARYQHVVTHPDFRRRRFASALVKLAGDYARNELGADLLVMIADAHDVARIAYAGAGFADVGVWRGLQRTGY